MYFTVLSVLRGVFCDSGFHNTRTHDTPVLGLKRLAVSFKAPPPFFCLFEFLFLAISQLARSQSLNQSLSLLLAVKVLSPDCWTTRELPRELPKSI